jgi:hypothetical protein
MRNFGKVFWGQVALYFLHLHLHLHVVTKRDRSLCNAFHLHSVTFLVDLEHGQETKEKYSPEAQAGD